MNLLRSANLQNAHWRLHESIFTLNQLYSLYPSEMLLLEQ
jgi:hypothetical protein